MAKWFGRIGYAKSVEVRPGVYADEFTERNYYGDINRYTRSLQTVDKLNDDLNVSVELSIVADPYAMEHVHSMRYAEFMGVEWKITQVNVQHPRLILTLGGVYNGKQT